MRAKGTTRLLQGSLSPADTFEVMHTGNSPRPRAGSYTIAVLGLVCALLPGSAWAANRPSDGEIPPDLAPAIEVNDTYFSGEAIVRFKPSTSAANRQEARSAADVSFERTFGLPGAQVVSVEGSVRDAVRRLEGQPGVEYAQPNYRYEALAAPAPNDTFFGELWGLSDPAQPNPGVGALDAWEKTKGNGQVIAVLDTGVDLTHPDISGNLWTNPSPDPVDEDLHGYDFVDKDGDPDDYNFHGTHVAGTAAAVADNNEGIAGVAPEAEIMAVRVLDGDGSGSTDDIAAGIDYAAEHGADVINMSLGGPSGVGDKAMSEAIKQAGEANVVVVVAAGNDGTDNDAEPHTPCALPETNLICVAALNQSGSLASFSDYGAKSVDIAAPGTSILSAKTDYGSPLFSDGFDSGLGSTWTTEAFNGGIPWGTSSIVSSPPLSATDSPGSNYGEAPNSSKTAESDLFTTAPVNLTGQRGCRLNFKSMYEIESFFDVFAAGASSEASTFDVNGFDGISPGYPSSLLREEASVSELDGRSDVHPIFAVLSDNEVEFDGAYVDDVRLFCRDETYVNEIATSSNYDQPNSGNYVRFQGTSMATPHVAGVVALVRAAAPGLSAEEDVAAVLEGASAIPSITPGRRIATEGIADACKAIAVATGGNVEAECPASSKPAPQPQPSGGSVTVTIPPEPQLETSTPPTPQATPNTFLLRRPPNVLHTAGDTAKAVFRFGSSEPGVSFLCKVDRGRFHDCPARFVRRYSLGRHVLRVKARNSDGKTDSTPAVYRFRVARRS
jgi:thermitase